jgi:hypothetical protein
MIKNIVPCILMLSLLVAGLNGLAQTKPAATTKKPAATKQPAKPAAKPDEVKEEMPPPMVDSAVSATPVLPPLPDIDTTAAPNDDLTKEIKKLLSITNSMNTAVVVMKATIESQRKSQNVQLPEEFYTRFIAAIDNGQIGGMLENVIIKIYRQKFTKEEMQEVIKFYESPVGKKMAAESAFIASSSSTEGEKIGQYVALKIIEGLMKEGKWK